MDVPETLHAAAVEDKQINETEQSTIVARTGTDTVAGAEGAAVGEAVPLGDSATPATVPASVTAILETNVNSTKHVTEAQVVEGPAPLGKCQP